MQSQMFNGAIPEEHMWAGEVRLDALMKLHHQQATWLLESIRLTLKSKPSGTVLILPFVMNYRQAECVYKTYDRLEKKTEVSEPADRVEATFMKQTFPSALLMPELFIGKRRTPVSQEDSIQKIQNQGKPEVREALKNDLIAELNAPVASGTLFFTLLGYLKDAEVIDPYTKKQGYTQLQSKIRFAPITFEFEPEHTPAFKEQYRSCQLAWILQSLSENSECSLLHLFRGDSSVSLEHQGAQYKKEAFYCLDEHLLEEPITLKMRKKIYEQLNQVYRPVGSKIVLGGSITEVESPLGTARPTSKWVRQHSDEGIRSPTPLPANGYARATASVQIGFVTASPQPEGRPRSDMTGLGSQVRTSWGQPANNQEQPRESICSRVCSCIVFRDRGVDTRVDGYAAID